MLHSPYGRRAAIEPTDGARYHCRDQASRQLPPLELARRRARIIRCSLCEPLHLSDGLPILLKLREILLCAPRDLVGVSHSDIRSLLGSWPDHSLVLSLWKAASTSTGHRGKRVAPLPMMASLDIAASLPARRRRGDIDDLPIPPDFGPSGRRAKINAISNAAPDIGKMRQFLDAGLSINIVRRTIDSLPIVAAGVSCYADFATFYMCHIPYIPWVE